MIINFSVQNFGSIKDKQTLSFEADKSTHLEDYYVVKVAENLRLLKVALIYGANASGKTTILKALDFLGQLATDPLDNKNEKLDYNPFLFDPETPHQNTRFELEFFQNGVKYAYEVEFNQKAVVREQLLSYNPKKALVFERTTDEGKQLTEIKFGQKVRIGKQEARILELNTLWNNTVLGGFQKTNLEQYELKEASDWFLHYLETLVNAGHDAELNGIITEDINNGHLNKKLVLEVLKKADFQISDFSFKQEESNVFDGLKTFVEAIPMFNTEYVNQLNQWSKYESMKVYFEHTVNGQSYKLPMELESDGTQRYYMFAGFLSKLLSGPTVLLIDELEASLHPELYQHFLLTFLVNAKQSQIIATTHNREILDDKNLFRFDAIWFTDKPKNGATELYSLADFDSSVVRKDTGSVLNAYKAGRLGATPNFGDYYINLEDAE